MSAWGWVALAYGATFGALIAYSASLARRVRRARRDLDAA